MTFIGLGFDDCLAHYLGLELPSLRNPSVLGLRIPQVDRRDRPLQPKHVDAHGYGIESAHMRGGDWKTAHDAVLRVLAADVKSAGLRAEAEYHGLLDGCLPPGVVGPSIDLYGLCAFGQPAGWREPQVRRGVPCELKRLSSGTESCSLESALFHWFLCCHGPEHPSIPCSGTKRTEHRLFNIRGGCYELP